MSSNESSRPRRNATRNGTTSASSSSQSSQGASSSSSTTSGSSRPIRSSRLKASNQINLADDLSDNSDSDDIKPLTTSSFSSKKQISNPTLSNKIDIDKLAKLESITGLSRAEAIQLLEASNNKLEKAVDLHFNGSNLDKNTKKTGTSSNGLNGSHKRAFNHVTEDSNSSEAVYSNEDNVRAPIPQKTEKILDYDPYMMGVEPKAKRVRSVFDSFNETDHTGLASSSHSVKGKSLEALYKPPIDLLFKGSFEASKIEGCKKNKWLIVNVQDSSDFTCQCLNRDLWREDTVKEIMRANFVFVQVYFDSVEGKKLINYYRISSYPFLAILDPRTGENVLSFTNISKMDQFMFCEKITNFLCDYESPIKDFCENGEDNDDDTDIVQLDEEESRDSKSSKDDCVLIKNIKTESNKNQFIKSSDLLKELNGDEDEDILINGDSNSSEENFKYKKQNHKNRLDSSNDEEEVVTSKEKPRDYEPKMIRYETPDTNKKDCVLRILYPNGDRLDYCTNGASKFKDLVDYLIKQGYNRKSYELIERLMPTIKQQTETSSEECTSSQKISNDLSKLIITNQSRNLFNLDNLGIKMTFKELNLFPRVFLLLQEL